MSSVAQRANDSAGYTTTPKGGYHPAGLITSEQPVMALSPRKVHTSERAAEGAVPVGSGHPPVPALDGLNTEGRLCGPIRLPLNGFTYS